MPLSDREQHLLEQMEQALYAEDPKFASHMQGVGAAAKRRRYIIGGVGFVVGLAVVLLGVTMSNMWVGAVGFLVMVAAVWQAVTPPRKPKAALGTVRQDGTVQQVSVRSGRKSKAPKSGHTASTGTFMQRLEQRWERRRDQ